MTAENILTFIRTGEIEGIKTGMSIPDVRERLGEPEEIVGDSKAGYLMYGIFRVGYMGNVIDELAILFYKEKEMFFDIELGNIEEFIRVSGNTRINEFIQLLNSRGMVWECYDKRSLDYFTICSEARVYIVFDLCDGTLNMISYVVNAL